MDAFVWHLSPCDQDHRVCKAYCVCYLALGRKCLPISFRVLCPLNLGPLAYDETIMGGPALVSTPTVDVLVLSFSLSLDTCAGCA